MQDYQPISCSYYDHLEALAVRGVAVQLLYVADTGTETEVHTRITDLLTRDGVEYLYTDTGAEIRLDKLLSVNGLAPDLSCRTA